MRLRPWRWQQLTSASLYVQALPIGVAVGISVLCVVIFGNMVGSLLPFILRGLGADPATSSTPFVATIVDVCGLLIYFFVASSILQLAAN
jgi:magnesium transporter